MIRRALLCSMVVFAAGMSAQTHRGISSDIIDTYTEMIANNPESADLYLSRAGEYQSSGRFSLALDDLTKALSLDKNSDKGMRHAILSRRAAVREITGDIDGAIEDLTEAITLFPDQPSSLSSRARLHIKQGNLDAARADYLKIRRQIPRDPQAIFGLAKVEALAGDADKAIGLANEAVDLYPKKGSSYSGKAEILKTLHRPEAAIDQYLQAVFCDDAASGEAIQKLVDLSYEDFPAVLNGFNRALDEKPTSGILYYLRASVCSAHNHHLQALEDLDHINGSGPFINGVLDVPRAESMVSLGRYQDAESLLESTPATRKTATYYLILSKLQHAVGNNEAALQSASSALMLAPESADAMAAKAGILLALNRNQEASALLAEAIMTQSDRPLYYLQRTAATGSPEFARVALDLPYEPDDPNSLRGFLLLVDGKPEQADAWMSAVMRLAPDTDGSASYIAACYYAYRENYDKAFEYMEKALDKGYANAYNWLTDDTPYVSVAPLRTQQRFADILDKNASKFLKQ